MKRWYVQLLALLILGSGLLVVNFDIINGVRNVGHSELLGWLHLAGLGFTAMLPLIFILCVDAIWLWVFIVWLLRKVLHIKSKDNTLYLT